jgi:hypothetical protein
LRMSFRILAAGSGSGTPVSTGSSVRLVFMRYPQEIVLGSLLIAAGTISYVIDLKRPFQFLEVGMPLA